MSIKFINSEDYIFVNSLILKALFLFFVYPESECRLNSLILKTLFLLIHYSEGFIFVFSIPRK